MERITYGRGATEIQGVFGLVGDDFYLIISGGNHPHIGAVALAIPRPSLRDKNTASASVSVLTRTGHKDDEIARASAIYLASLIRRNTVVMAGIHLDDATEDQIKAYIDNAQGLTGRVAGKMITLAGSGD